MQFIDSVLLLEKKLTINMSSLTLASVNASHRTADSVNQSDKRQQRGNAKLATQIFLLFLWQ